MKSRSQRYTTFDFTYAAVAAPMLALIAMMIYAEISWRTQAKRSDSAWQSVTDSLGGKDPMRLASWYEAHKSKEQTWNFNRVLASCDAIFAANDAWLNHLDPTEFITPAPPDEPLPMERVVRKLASDAKPVLKLLSEIEPEFANVWQPFVFDKEESLLPTAIKSRNLIRLLKIEFLDAYHAGENQRAIEAIVLLDRFYGGEYRTISAAEETIRMEAESTLRKLVLHSLVHDVWNESDLARIQSLLSKEAHWQRRWNDLTRGQILRDRPWEDRIFYGYAFRSLWLLCPAMHVAPSERHDLARRFTTIIADDHVASAKHLQEITGLERPLSGSKSSPGARDSSWAADRWIQFPQMNSDWRELGLFNNYAGVAHDLADAFKEKRLTQCAIAIKRFVKRYDRFPDSLSQLTEHGLPAEVLNDRGIALFRYEPIKRDSVRLWLRAFPQPDSNPNRPRPEFWNQTVVTK